SASLPQQWEELQIHHTSPRVHGRASEPAFVDHDCVAGAEELGNGGDEAYDVPVDVAADLDRAAVATRRIAAGNRDRRLHGHVGDIGILAGQNDLAEDEER